MRHIDQHVLLKLVVVISTAVVIIYFSAIGYIDFGSSTSSSATNDAALTPTEAGQQLASAGKYDEAITLYKDQITALETELATANLNLADTYQANQQPADAEALYRRVIRLQDQTKAAYVGLANVLVDQGKKTDASTVIKQGLVKFPGDVDLTAIAAQLAESAAQ